MENKAFDENKMKESHNTLMEKMKE